jgi:hypothetical protein
MTGLTDFITDAPWTHLLLLWFVLVDDAYQALAHHYGAWRQRGPAPLFHDSEVITVALFIDTVFHGHEALGLSFLRQYHPDLFPHLLAPSTFNARRTQLGPLMEQIRRYLLLDWELIDPADQVRVVDSAPVQLCTYQSGNDCATLIGQEYFGVCASKGTKVYGWRLHVRTTLPGVVELWGLAPASTHDSQELAADLTELQDCLVLADGAFNQPSVRQEAQARQLRVYAVPRRDSRTPWPAEFRRLVTRVRRRVETTLSVLAVVFDIEQPRARSLAGAVCRIATRMLAHTLCFLTGVLLTQLRG